MASRKTIKNSKGGWMATIGKLWAGRVSGTNIGNLFIEFETTGPDLSGTLRFMDSTYGVAVYRITGTFNDELVLSGKPVQSAEGVELSELSANAKLTPEGNLRGTWSTALGTGGTFQAFPHDADNSPVDSNESTNIPEQIYTKNISLGAIRLYAEDVRKLVAHSQQDFTNPRPVVTFNSRGAQVSKYVEDFLKDAESFDELDYIKITIQEHEAHGINRLVVIELNAYGSNDVRVQGIQESWVIGKAESIASLLRVRQSALITTYKKFGLNLNQFVFVTMLVMMPSISFLWSRVIFAIVVVVLLNILLWLHARFIPNVAIYMGVVTPSVFKRWWPTILSWVGAVTASLAATLLYLWMTSKTNDEFLESIHLKSPASVVESKLAPSGDR